MSKEFRYCILYIQEAEQQKLINIIRKHMPEGRGEAFYPLMEYYRRDEKKVMRKPIFPGYVFLYTDLNIKEVHELISGHRAELCSGLRELRLSEQWLSDQNFLFRETDDNAIYDLSDVDECEKVFLDILREGNGLLTMSSGYEYSVESKKKGKYNKPVKKYMVMEGPLKVYEDKIIDVDKHNRKAFLEFEINGKQAQAGFNCLPKAHWYPQRDSKIVTFEDGTVTDLKELEKNVMTVK